MERKESLDSKLIPRKASAPFEIDDEDLSIIRQFIEPDQKKKDSKNPSKSNSKKTQATRTKINSRNLVFSEDTLEGKHIKEAADNNPKVRERKMVQSDIESESMSEKPMQRTTRVLDDSVQFESFGKPKTTYVNVMIAGESNICKFDFIKYMMETVFGAPPPRINDEDKINDFSYVMESRKQTKLVTFTHVHGFSSKYSIKVWYSLVKSQLKEKMEVYHNLKKMDKNKHNLLDPRIHLLFFFIKSPKIRLNEIVYLKKLQKYAVIVPILVDKSASEKLTSDYVKSIKLNLTKELTAYAIEPLDFEDDVALKKLQENMVSGMTPLFISAPNGRIDPKSQFSDLPCLVKLITTPYINSYVYHTEILYSKNIEKIVEKKEEKKKNNPEPAEDGKKIGFGFGVAFGIGVLGAIIALKDKFK